MPAPLEIRLPDEAATARLAERLAARARPGDVLLLDGPIGAGKSCLARAFIRARLGNPAEEVPSPTFTLVQTYPSDAGEIWHCDLYRLSGPDAVIELGLDEAFEEAICLVEWPDRLGDLAPAGALRISMAAGNDGHSATITAPPGWAERLERIDG